jgi:hypothetical protein
MQTSSRSFRLFVPLSAALALCAGTRAFDAGPLDPMKPVIDAWSKVRLQAQQLEVTLNRAEGKTAAEFSFAAPAGAGEAYVPWVLFHENAKAEQVKAFAGPKELTPVPHLLKAPAKVPPRKPGDPDFSRPKVPSDAERRGEQLRSCLDANQGFTLSDSDHNWFAYPVDFKAGAETKVRVEAALQPYPLADSTAGPCRAYRIPLRLGNFFAPPPGKIQAAITLGEDLSPDDVLLVRPANLKREGRTFSLQIENESPLEDLVVVIKDRPAK